MNQTEEENDEEPTVPDLPIIHPSNGNISLTPLRSSGATTPTNGILITTKYHRAQGSITPVGEANEDDSSIPVRKLGSKHVRFTALASSDEDERKSTKQKYGFKDQTKKQPGSAPDGGINPDAIVNEPRRKRLRSNLDLEETEAITARAHRAVSRSSSVESSNSQGNIQI